MSMRDGKNPGNIESNNSVQSVKNKDTMGPIKVKPVSFIITKPSTLFEEKVAIIKAMKGACKDDNKIIMKAFNKDMSISKPVTSNNAMVAILENINVRNNLKKI